MTEDELKAIKERVDACQPGPWTSVYKGECSQTVAQLPPNHLGNNLRLQVANCSVSSFGVQNAAFIAHARQDIPALIAEVERLRAGLDLSELRAAGFQKDARKAELKLDRAERALRQIADRNNWTGAEVAWSEGDIVYAWYPDGDLKDEPWQLAQDALSPASTEQTDRSQR